MNDVISRPRNVQPQAAATDPAPEPVAVVVPPKTDTGFWSKFAKPFRAIGRFFVDAWDDLPLVFEAVPVIKDTFPTLVSDLQSLMKAAGNFVQLCATDAKPLIAALASFFAAIAAAIAQRAVNLASDEAALAAGEEVYTVIKADVGASAAAFLSALHALVTAYDATAATVEAAIAKIKSLKGLDTGDPDPLQ